MGNAALQQLLQFFVNKADLRAKNDLAGRGGGADHTGSPGGFECLFVHLSAVFQLEAQPCGAAAGFLHIGLTAQRSQNVGGDAGMVKVGRHRTRALVTAQGREIDLHAAPNVFALIGQIQEETHRFAITFHHESHSRSSTRSALDGIPGVGKVRAQALLKTFKSVKAIREADIFALERVLPKDAAASVYLHFHGETDEKKDEM